MAPDGRTAFEMVEAISRDEGRSFIHPFEGPYTALGTATLGVEWLEQVPDLDAVIIAIGGGGLCGGASAAIKLMKPDCLVFGVEPTGSDTMTRSFALGKPIDHAEVRTIADSLAPPFALPTASALPPERRRHRLGRRRTDPVGHGAPVPRDEARGRAGGAAATAAVVGPLRERLAGRKVGVLICGSNIDFDSFERHIRQAEAAPLLSGEARLPFLHERGHALAIITAIAELAHGVALKVELFVEAVAPARADHRLDARQPLGRRGGEARGERVHFRIQPRRRPPSDQPQSAACCAGQRIGGQRQPQRARLATSRGSTQVPRCRG